MLRVLIVGAGDIAARLFPLLARSPCAARVYALVRSDKQAARWRAMGALPVRADLDDLASLQRIAGLADWVIHLAPPASEADGDRRTRHLLAALGRRRERPLRLVYISTTGVYGDRAGVRVDETAALRPDTPRARRRVAAETSLRRFGRLRHTHHAHRCARQGVRRISILRVPGIYAADRLPVERLRQRTPAIIDAEDGFTNHIHADDLARVIMATLRRGRPNRVYNAVDSSPMQMGKYFDLVADATGLPRVPRITRREAESVLSPALLSFMAESRQVGNRRMREELKVKLLYPHVADGLADVKKFSRGS